MRALVTGGAGFIGSHLCEALVRQGHETWALDDLSTGRIENLVTLQSSPRFHFRRGDVRDASLVREMVACCDRVFHLAAAVGVKYILENPLSSLLTNVRGTEVVLEACDEYGIRAVLFSSSEVYGKGAAVPFAEDDDRVMGPTQKLRWSYACGKAVDECLAFAYWEMRRLPVTIVRCFNTCGPRQTGAYGMVVPSMIRRALHNEPILVHGDGRQTRCFSAVDDVVRGVLLLADSAATHGEVFNIGTDEEVSILDLANRIRSKCGSRSSIEFVPYEAIYGRSFEDLRRRVPDLRKVREAVGYGPRVTLDELLDRTIQEERHRIKGGAPAGRAA